MEELESAANLPHESPFAEAQTPRLSILHLMLWTFCTAIDLSLIRAIYAIQGDMPSGYATILNTTSVIQGIVTGAALAAAVVLVSTRVRSGPPMLRQPGHWLLFVSAVAHVPLMISLLLQRVDTNQTWYLVFYGLNYLLPTIAYAFAARHSRALSWKVIFVGLVLLSLAQCLFYVGMGLGDRFVRWFGILYSIPTWGSLVLAGAVMVLSIAELVAGERRDWLHWTGVTTYVARSSVVLLWVIGSWFVR